MSAVVTKRRGRPIAGAIAGLLLGAFVAIDLAIFAIRPLDNLSVIGLPLVGMVVGILLGVWAPFGGRSKSPEGAPPAAPAPEQARAPE